MIVENNKNGIQVIENKPAPVTPQDVAPVEKVEVVQTPVAPKENFDPLKDTLHKETPKAPLKEDSVGIQKRIDKLTWRNGEYQRQLEAKEAEIAKINAQLAEIQSKLNPPKFKDENERFEHFVNSKVQEQLRQRDEASSRDAEISSKAEKVQNRIKESLDTLKEHFPDAIEVISQHQDPLPNEAFQFILASDVSGPLSYLIAKDEDIQRKIASFDDALSLERYLLRLEIKAESMIEEAKKSKSQLPEVPQTQRQAPTTKPINPITPKSTSFKQTAPDPSKNTSEWIKWRNEQERTKKG